MELTADELVLKTKLNNTAKLIADLANEPRVFKEFSQLADDKHDFSTLSFSELLESPVTKKGNKVLNFSNLRKELINAKSDDSDSELLDYLVKEDCYIYIPYPLDWYPEERHFFTVTAHPIDNEEEGIGYMFTENGYESFIIDEGYADDYPVMIIMPEHPGLPDGGGSGDTSEPGGGSGGVSGDPIYESKLGYIWYDKSVNLFSPPYFDLRVLRGEGTWDPVNTTVSGSWPVQIQVNYPRKYAKAASNGWTIYSNGGWYYVNIPWDTNWKPEKSLQCIAVYRYQNVSTQTLQAQVGYKAESWSSQITTTTETTYKGDFLGSSEWSRDWFYTTQDTYEQYRGAAIRSTGSSIRFTITTSTL